MMKKGEAKEDMSCKNGAAERQPINFNQCFSEFKNLGWVKSVARWLLAGSIGAFATAIIAEPPLIPIATRALAFL